MCNEKFFEQVAYVLASKHRTNIVFSLEKGLLTPTQIGKEINLSPNHTSNLLKQLTDFEVVYCATPKIKKGKLYSLTESGLEVLKYIQQQAEK